MKLTRRQVIAAGASAGAYMAIGASNALAKEQRTVISKIIPATGEALPVIGIGTNRWVAAGLASEMQGLRDTLQIFKDMGGRVIDTAPVYRTSEKALGQIIRQLGLDDAFFLATKVDKTEKAAGIKRMEASLEKLHRKSMDLMQIHNMRGAEAQLETLLEWRETGRIRYIGITTSRTDQHAEMEALMNSKPLDFVQVNYSLRDRAAENRLLPLALEKGIAVLANRPFAHGRLFKDVGGATPPSWAAEFDCDTWAQFFLKYVVAHPAVTCAIPGMTKLVHATDNMGANFGRLPDAQLRARQEQVLASI